MALEATDRCDAQGSQAAVERAGRVPMRAQEELGLGDVSAVVPEREGARAEAMTAVRAEGGAVTGPGMPSTVSRCLRWKTRTAAMVRGPMTPSIAPE